MTKKTRLIILTSCIACFFIVAPILVLYSEGYRFDFKKMEIVATGGIYVRTFPAADKITIDDNISEKPGLFGNSVFVQSLLPENHMVSIQKTGYYGYQKTIPVQENQVTKIENVLLIKKSIGFSDIADNAAYFSAAPDNQNIITETNDASSETFRYFSISAPSQQKTFSVMQPGIVQAIQWSADSSKALIKIQNGSSIYYYEANTTLAKPVAVRLSYLDVNAREITFDAQDSQTLFYIKNTTLYSAKGTASLPIISGVISFELSGTDIVWLSPKGTLSESDFAGKLENQMSLKNVPLDAGQTYQLISIPGTIALQDANKLFIFDQSAKIFEPVSIPLTDYTSSVSGDGSNTVYWNNNAIYLYPSAAKKFVLLFSGSQISNVQWLNNSYLIFTSGNNIIISEIDYRGNINAITLPNNITLSANKKISIVSPSLVFNQQSGKIYLLTDTTLLSSDKITP